MPLDNKHFLLCIKKDVINGVYSPNPLDHHMGYFLSKGIEGWLFIYPCYYTRGNILSLQKVTSTEITPLVNIPVVPLLGRYNKILELVILIYAKFKLIPRDVYVLVEDYTHVLLMCLFKIVGLVKTVHFHLRYYSPNAESLAGRIHLFFLSSAIYCASLVTTPTKRLLSQLDSLKLSSPAFHLPNAVPVEVFNKYKVSKSQRVTNQLVCVVSSVSAKYKLLDLLSAFNKLTKEVETAQLTIIGNTTADTHYYREVKEYIRVHDLKHLVHFTGFLETEKALSYIAHCWAAVALYNKTFDELVYTDAKKLREYAALGIPFITDGVTETSSEIDSFNAGIVVTDLSELYIKMKEILGNSALYDSLSSGCDAWAEQNDLYRIMDSILINTNK